MIDLTIPNIAYMFGFLQADGSLYKNIKNKGKLTIELQRGDRYILEEFKKMINFYSSIRDRNRNTNFKQNYLSSVLCVYNKKFRDELVELGIPYGKKSDTLKPPSFEIKVNDYIRGLIDGDGSLGLTEKGFPFLSLTTKSELIKKYYLNYIYLLTEKTKNSKRNTRDSIFNIVVYKEDAQTITSALYYDGCFCLERKREKALQILSWKRPINMRKVIKMFKWGEESDGYILTHSLSESIKHLNITKSSIQTRLWRLNKLYKGDNI